jgi:hypothetical protein
VRCDAGPPYGSDYLISIVKRGSKELMSKEHKAQMKAYSAWQKSYPATCTQSRASDAFLAGWRAAVWWMRKREEKRRRRKEKRRKSR